MENGSCMRVKQQEAVPQITILVICLYLSQIFDLPTFDDSLIQHGHCFYSDVQCSWILRCHRNKGRPRAVPTPKSWVDLVECPNHPNPSPMKNPIWLVVWLTSILFSHFHIGNFIIPIDELIFFRGVAEPPTSNASSFLLVINPSESHRIQLRLVRLVNYFHGLPDATSAKFQAFFDVSSVADRSRGVTCVGLLNSKRSMGGNNKWGIPKIDGFTRENLLQAHC